MISSILLSSILFALSANGQTLKAAAGSRYFGAALGQPHLQNASDPKFAEFASAQFSGATPENEMKWENTEPEEGTFTFTDADVIVSFAKQNNFKLRCHNLVWGQQLASYVTSAPASQLQAIMVEHITGVMNHFKGDCFAWDVINEPFNDDGTFQATPFFNAMGEEYITIALQTARSIDPSAHLYINDFNTEGENAKSNAMLNLTTSLKQKGLLDGVGFESHFILNEIPTGIQANLERFTAAGLEVAITELDIRMELPATQQDLQEQETQFNQVVAACVAVAKCVGVTTWGITDMYSWVLTTFPGMGAPLLFDNSYNEKPSFSGVISALG